MIRNVFLLVLCCAAWQNAPGQTSVETPLLAHVNMYAQTGYNDCWGYTAPDGREYALLGVRTGTSIIDITQAPLVREVAFIPSPPSVWKDIKTFRHYAYVVNENGGGLQIIDLSPLPDSVRYVGASNVLTTSHNISIDTARAMLYAEGEGTIPVRAISLANPVNPVQVSFFGIPCHDVYARNGIVYTAEGGNGSFAIYDLTNAASPVLVKRFAIPRAGYVHNAWPSEDNRYLMTTEETAGRTVKLWYIGHPDSIRLMSEYAASPFIAHNTHIMGDHAYISYYTEGLRIVDISNPSNVFEVAYYDTYSGPGGGFNGAWGAFPFFTSGKVLISDMQTGLYVVHFQTADSLDPHPPNGLSAFSDYRTPTSIRLRWSDPATLVNGTPLPPGSFSIRIWREGNLVGTVPGGVLEFSDAGLIDGRRYSYLLRTRVNASDSMSSPVLTSWIAGGSPVPNPPRELSWGGIGLNITLRWRNPATNVDGTVMDDFGGIRVYQNDTLIMTLQRQPADTARVDSVQFLAQGAAPFQWHVTAIDNENPVNESAASESVRSSLVLPIRDSFSWNGPPNSVLWSTQNAFVSDRAFQPPSPPFALNLNGKPNGGDTIELQPVNLQGLDNSGVALSYSYQPQGLGDPPEPEDSLIVYFRNNLGNWVKVRSYPGTSLQPFQAETILLNAAPNEGGSYFYPFFQVRFRSIGEAHPINNLDEWFLDDISLDVLTPVESELGLPGEPALYQNFPNPFNPSTTIRYDVPRSVRATVSVYDLLGRRVRALADGMHNAGRFTVVWDGRNDNGVAVASGVYLCRLDVAGVCQTIPMILLR